MMNSLALHLMLLGVLMVPFPIYGDEHAEVPIRVQAEMDTELSRFWESLLALETVASVEQVLSKLDPKADGFFKKHNIGFLRIQAMLVAEHKISVEPLVLHRAVRMLLTETQKSPKKFASIDDVKQFVGATKTDNVSRKGALTVNVNGLNGVSRPKAGIAFGRNGANGKNATGGGPAGSVLIKLTPSGSGYRAEKDVNGEKTTDELKANASINTTARGGHGGKGGDGGDGTRGYTGSRGSPAPSRSSGSGGTGGRGGPGGDGGNGGNGGYAGPGGPITLITTPHGSFLFSLVDSHNISAGTPGGKGVGGSGGPGGFGGAGGSGSSWTTTEYYSERVSSRNADGTTSYSTVQRSRTKYHSNPSGSQGSSGFSGSDGNNGVSGARARDGTFSYVIDHGNGVLKRYKTRYNLAGSAYQLVTPLGKSKREPYLLIDVNGDGIFEPGEAGELVGLRVVNSGREMPTPPPNPSSILLTLGQGDTWHRPHGNPLFLDRSLMPGEKYRFSSNLPFTITDIKKPLVNRVFLESFTVRPQARIHPTGRGFSDFHIDRSREVKFPVKLSLEAPGSLTRGQWGKVRLRVTNVLEHRTLGSEAEISRIVSLFLTDKPGQTKSMHFTDNDGVPKDLRTGLFRAIQNLKPGESRTIEGLLQVPENFEPFAAYTFDSFLHLGLLDDPTKSRPVQEEVHRLSVSTRYETDADADIVIVWNKETRREEVLAWESMLEKELGFDMSDWHISYYGNFDLDREIVADPRWHLLKDFSDKTVILLNNKFKSYSGTHGVTAWQNLSKHAFVSSVERNGSNYLVLGNVDGKAGKEATSTAYVQTKPPPGSRNFNNVETLIRSIEVGDRDRLTDHSRTPISGIWRRARITAKYWGTPTREDFTKKVDALKKDLARLWPNRNYKVSSHYRGSVTKPGGFARRKTVDMGDIIVQRFPDEPDRVAVTASVSDQDLHDPKYIQSDTNLRNVFMSLSPPNKLKLLDRLIGYLNEDPSELQKRAGVILVDALLDDIMIEYKGALKGALWGGFPGPRTLSRLRDKRFQNQVKPGSEAEVMFKRLYVRARLAGHWGYSGWALWGSQKSAVKDGQKSLEIWGRRMFTDHSDWKSAREAFDDELVAMKKLADFPGFFKFPGHTLKHNRVIEILAKETEDPHRISAADVFNQTQLGILPHRSIGEQRLADQARRERWEELTRENLRSRKDLKVEDPRKK